MNFTRQYKNKWEQKQQPYYVMSLFYTKFVLLCVISGLGAGLFSLATDKTYFMFKHFSQQFPYGVFVLTPLVFMGIVFLLKRYFPYASGSGLSQGYALDAYGKSCLEDTYSLWTMLGKIIYGKKLS